MQEEFLDEDPENPYVKLCKQRLGRIGHLKMFKVPKS